MLFYSIREREAHMRALKDIITVAGPDADADADAIAAVDATAANTAASAVTKTWAAFVPLLPRLLSFPLEWVMAVVSGRGV